MFEFFKNIFFMLIRFRTSSPPPSTPPPSPISTRITDQDQLPNDFWEEFAYCPCTVTNTTLIHSDIHCKKYQNSKFNPSNTTKINNTDNPAPARIKSNIL